MTEISRSGVVALVMFVAVSTILVVKGPSAYARDMVIRHGTTYSDQADTEPLNFDNIAAQRHLNHKGKVLTKAVGDAPRQAGVAVGKVYVRKHNSAYQTALMAGFKDVEETADFTEGSLVVSPEDCVAKHDGFCGRGPTENFGRLLVQLSREGSLRA